jgi:outer membrane lipoprotein LolB
MLNNLQMKKIPRLLRSLPPFAKGALFILTSAFVLSGCAIIAPSNTMNAMHESNTPTDYWVLRGKIGIKTPEKADSASVYWSQEKENYNLKLFGPLGMGAVELKGKPGEVVYIDNQGHSYQASSAEILLQQNLGWQLPVSNLSYWVRALPAPNIASQKNYNINHQLILLQQQGWNINYLDYQSQLPHIIQLKNGNIDLRLVINQWQFYSPPKA